MLIAFSRIRAFGSGNSGATAVEFALVAPLLFLLMFALMEFGRAWWTKNSLQYAVERATRYAVVCATGACPGDGAIKTYAANQVYSQTIDSSAFTVTRPAGALCINYSYNFAPWFVGGLDILEGSVTLTGTSCRAHS
ncbi:MAG TPA: TadE/TadG family type IV pilus assembly protein [Xanthobacteraceae bacterium]|jgi:Flp pilus assembly protein TadG|nr:TadE/TadG family type IV pilus assembly protein [Xanthobacteraceae bacterium]